MTSLHQFANVAHGLAFEEKLFADKEPRVGVWSAASNALVCPASYRNRAEFAHAAVRSDALGWPVLFRSTGGGAVPQGPGVLNFTVAITVDGGFSMERGYQLLVRAIRAALGHGGRELAAGAVNNSFCDGRWNLVHRRKKVAGAAQHWRSAGRGKTRILAHAAILAGNAIMSGINAVDALHRNLGLAPVNAESHATLESEIGPDALHAEDFAARLRRAALREIAAAGGIKFPVAA